MNESMMTAAPGKQAKGYVPIFYDWVETTQDLSDEEKGRLIDAVILYACGSPEWEARIQTTAEKVAFRFMKGQIDRFNAISGVRSAAGQRKKGQPEPDDSESDQTGRNDHESDQTPANDNKTDQTETNASYNNNNNNNNNNKNKNENNNEKENEKGNGNESKKRGRSFAPPTLEEVRAYCMERNNGIDPEYWMDYYAARDWVMTNRKKMSDWKAGIRTWEKNHFSRDRPREPVRTVSAQQYTQRDYADVEARAMRKLIEMGHLD